MTDSPKKILIVEDDEEIAYIIDFMLKREGYETTRATDGKQAIDYVHQQPPVNLVTLDLMLPYRDGFQVLAEIRRQPGWENIPVIILSAKTQEADIVRGLSTGSNDYLTKPFQPMELLARIRRLVK